MRYISNFYSLGGDKYDVTIITNKSSGTTREITLGVPPFVTEMDTSSENIYKPVKCQSASVTIITDDESDYMFDMYSGEADGTRVTLSKSGTTIWDGFATPVIYNNGYTEIHEKLQLECIDGLSILEYYKYSSSNKQILSFIDIVNKILAKAQVYTTLYVSSATRLTSTAATPILNELYISEQNFFNEKKDNETDNDVAWTCKEVLEEICQYLGMVMVGDANSVYMLDPDALKKGITQYDRYTIGSTAHTSVRLTSTKAVEEEDYRGGNNTISLDNVYNKVSVRDDFYTFDSLIPNMYDNLVNITKSSDPEVEQSESLIDGAYGEILQTNDGYMEVLIEALYKAHYNLIFVKYYKNNNYNFVCPAALNYTDTKTVHGSYISKMYVKNLDKHPDFADILEGRATLDDWLNINGLSNPTLKNYTVMMNPNDSSHVTSGTPWITTSSTELPCLFGGENNYIIIQGSYYYHYKDSDPYPIPQGLIDLSEGRYAMKQGQTYVLAKLKWGDKYWNGTAWTTTDSTFHLPYLSDDARGDDRRADATMFNDIDFVNTVSWRLGTSEKGYAIPVPHVATSAPQLTIYSPIDPDYVSESSGDDYGKWYKHTRVYMENFDIKALVGDPSLSNVNDTDTIYTNVINNSHVQELDEITFKICTNDNKNPSYSLVCYKNGSEYNFLNTTYNRALGANNKQEEHLINRLANQYKQPKIRLVLEIKNEIAPYTVVTDKWLDGKTFIVDSQSIDYYDDKTTITLVEKG